MEDISSSVSIQYHLKKKKKKSVIKTQVEEYLTDSLKQNRLTHSTEIVCHVTCPFWQFITSNLKHEENESPGNG